MERPGRFAAPSVRRLPSYLSIIKELQQQGQQFVFGAGIARELQLDSIQVRKDLAMTGILGKPKRGYPAGDLAAAIEHFLGWDCTRDAALVGAGNLGTALLGYREFLLHGLNITAAFDINPRKIGSEIHNTKVFNAETMDIQIRGLGIKIAVLTVPPENAQKSAELLVRAGIEGIWNFTTVKLKVPAAVAVQQEDLSAGYAMLSVKMKSLRAGHIRG